MNGCWRMRKVQHTYVFITGRVSLCGLPDDLLNYLFMLCMACGGPRGFRDKICHFIGPRSNTEKGRMCLDRLAGACFTESFHAGHVVRLGRHGWLTLISIAIPGFPLIFIYILKLMYDDRSGHQGLEEAQQRFNDNPTDSDESSHIIWDWRRYADTNPLEKSGEP
ncbi:hypothetical protein BJY04DRAFT_195748 [Aspergillus karnatakaensis]|uniref:uncharacterized protein n=1 Tax=Aspergillus karnatakaensis TaxID=1810916 RepID=UPI003CCD2E21